MLHAHYCTAQRAFATGTVLETFDCTSFCAIKITFMSLFCHLWGELMFSNPQTEAKSSNWEMVSVCRSENNTHDLWVKFFSLNAFLSFSRLMQETRLRPHSIAALLTARSHITIHKKKLLDDRVMPLSMEKKQAILKNPERGQTAASRRRTSGRRHSLRGELWWRKTDGLEVFLFWRLVITTRRASRE